MKCFGGSGEKQYLCGANSALPHHGKRTLMTKYEVREVTAAFHLLNRALHLLKRVDGTKEPSVVDACQAILLARVSLKDKIDPS